MKKIYLDYAATTPVDDKVLKSMLPYFSEKFGNASSLHSFGVEASEAVEKARVTVADFFGAENKEEIIFTSGATESNNLAIKGVVKAYYVNPSFWTSDVQMHSGHPMSKMVKPHIITTAFEHHCVLYAVKRLEKEGLIEATYIQPQRDGVIRAADIQKAIQKNTVLVSVMYVNNEIGTVQPIAQIGKIIKKHNSKIQDTKYKILFHTDATQAVSYFDCDVKKLGVDMLSMSAHKIYGPKGVGALYIKKGTPIKMIQDGGAQENGLRAGTINSAGIIGLGKAIELLKTVKNKNSEIEKLRNYLIEKVLQEIPKTKLNGSRIKRSPNNANFSFSDVEGESLLIMLDAAGIAGSTGSACSSGSLAPSHVLMSLGMKAEEAHGSLRLTLGKNTTKKEIDETVKQLKKIISDLRKISGNLLGDYYKNKK